MLAVSCAPQRIVESSVLWLPFTVVSLIPSNVRGRLRLKAVNSPVLNRVLKLLPPDHDMRSHYRSYGTCAIECVTSSDLRNPQRYVDCGVVKFLSCMKFVSYGFVLSITVRIEQVTIAVRCRIMSRRYRDRFTALLLSNPNIFHRLSHLFWKFTQRILLNPFFP